MIFKEKKFFSLKMSSDTLEISKENSTKEILNIRISEKHKISCQVSELENKRDRLLRSVDELKHSIIKDKTFINKKINANKAEAESLEISINELKNTLRAIDNGEHDLRLTETIQINTEMSADKLKLTKEKKQKLKGASHKDVKLAQTIYKSDKKEDYLKRQENYAFIKEYKYYASFIPHERFLNNLENMPNNKGYIVCGHWFFGRQPPDNGPLVMFENIGKIQYIYEFHPDRKVTYKKEQPDNRKILVEDIQRKNPLQSVIDRISWIYGS